MIMKQILSLIAAGIIGGMITLAGFHWLQPEAPQSNLDKETAHLVNYKIPVLPSSAPAFDFKSAARVATPAVVHIVSSSNGTRTTEEEGAFRYFFGGPDNRPQRGSGSGVIYSEDGYIITNNHVVDNADKVEVTLADNRTFNAKIVGTEERSDLAVLKIEANNLPTLQTADSDKTEVGEWVLAVGNPFELNSTVTAGIVSAKGRNIRLIDTEGAIEAFIQTDAAVNPGNSGGALVDAEGRLLGINTAIATRTGVYSGYSFAIPINLAKKIVDDIIEYGSYQRAYLGVGIQEIDLYLAVELGLKVNQGVVVTRVFDGGSAQYAGIQENDVITYVDNKKITNIAELQETIGRAQVGETVNLTVNRFGRDKNLPVRLKSQLETSNN